MKTMTHTPEQRKDWHAGKRQRNILTNKPETPLETFIRAAQKCNMRGACTPVFVKRGIFYDPKKT